LFLATLRVQLSADRQLVGIIDRWLT